MKITFPVSPLISKPQSELTGKNADVMTFISEPQSNRWTENQNK
jgi:hypothetical protein